MARWLVRRLQGILFRWLFGSSVDSYVSPPSDVSDPPKVIIIMPKGYGALVTPIPSVTYTRLLLKYMRFQSKTVGLIAKLRHMVPNRTLLNVYKSLIVPYITYGLTSWGNASETMLNKVLVLQKRALRLIHFAQTREHTIPLFLTGKLYESANDPRTANDPGP